MGDKKNFIWRYQPPISSDKATMLNYIDNQQLHPSHNKTELMVRSLTSYYMPLALYGKGNCPKEKLELILADSAIAFANQLKYLCAVLNVDPNRIGSILFGAFQTTNSIPSQSPSSNMEADDDLDELDDDDFNPLEWNSSGIFTDSETFELSS